VTVVVAETDVVVIVNVCEVVAPAGMVTEAGTTALGSLLVRVTTAPPDGAGPVSTSLFAVVEAPPTIDDGDSTRALSAGAITVKVAVFVTPW
jgi:hypothetical protein